VSTCPHVSLFAGYFPEGGRLLSSCAVALTAVDAPEWIELIPAGKFSAVDGRGPFENSDPDAIVAASIAKMPQVGLVLDYDHSTDLAAPEGRPAPAAGWLKQFKVEHGAIFARIEWTTDAAEAVKEKKYRYVSPVFEHSKDGKVERILRAALTNNPALINLPALAQSEDAGFLARQPRAGMTGKVLMANKDGVKPKLSEVMASLEEAYPEASPQKLMKAAACLMADDDGDEDMAAGDDPYENESEEQMAARQAEEMARCASDGEKAECAKKHADEKARFAERTERNRGLETIAKTGEAKGNKSLQAAIAKHPMVVSMASEINEMRGAQAKACATQKVDAAIREGRLIPSQREWAITYCTADVDGFDKFIGAQPRIIQNGADGTFTGRIGDAPQGVAALNQREIDIFANLGLESEEQLKKCAAVKEKWTLKFPRPRLMLDDTNSGVAPEN
jgi:phage I-like protein